MNELEVYTVNWCLFGGNTWGQLTGTNRRKIIRTAASIISGYGVSGRIRGDFVYLKTDLSFDCLYVSRQGRVSK